MGEHTAPLGKGALKTGFGSLLGQGDFGEVYVSVRWRSGGLSYASFTGFMWTCLWQYLALDVLFPLANVQKHSILWLSSYLWMLTGVISGSTGGHGSLPCFSFCSLLCFQVLSCSFLFLCRTGKEWEEDFDKFLVFCVVMGWSEGQANKPTFGYYPGKWRVDGRVMIVACIFAIFLCQCGFLSSSFLSSEGSATVSILWFLQKTAKCALRARGDVLCRSPRSWKWPGPDERSACLSSLGPAAPAASALRLLTAQARRSYKAKSFVIFLLQIVLKSPSPLLF